MTALADKTRLAAIRLRIMAVLVGSRPRHRLRAWDRRRRHRAEAVDPDDEWNIRSRHTAIQCLRDMLLCQICEALRGFIPWRCVRVRSICRRPLADPAGRGRPRIVRAD